MAAQPPSVRWWPSWLILLFAAAAVGWTWMEEVDRQAKVMQTAFVFFLTGVALVLWIALLSRLAWRVRLKVLAGLLATAAGIVGLVRIDGVDGDLVPVLSWRWSHEAAAPRVGSVQDLTVTTSAQDFSQYLGSSRDGLVDVEVTTDWESSPPRELWRRPIGAGWSGFAVVGSLAVTHSQHDDSEVIVALDLKTGEPRWSFEYAARYDTTIGGAGPRTVPTIAGGRVFALGGTGVLTVLELATGELLWQRDVVAENGATVPDWGKSTAPLVLGSSVVVSAGGLEDASLVSYRVEDGEPIWSAGTASASYSSPLLVNLAGRDQIVIFNQTNVASHDPDNGDVLWQVPFPSQQPNVANPVVLDDNSLFVTTGYGIGGRRLEIQTDPSGFSVEEIWATPRLKSKFANVLYYQGYLYGLDDGVLVCLDPSNGERRWKRGRYGHGQLLMLGSNLLVQTEKGEVILLQVSPEGSEELARLEAFHGKTWNPPAVAGKYLVLRSHEEAVVYELPISGG